MAGNRAAQVQQLLKSVRGVPRHLVPAAQLHEVEHLLSFTNSARNHAPSQPRPPTDQDEKPQQQQQPRISNKVIFSGIQPTGVPHLGNYLGALRQWKTMQDQEAPDTKLIFSVVDLHAITVPQGSRRDQRAEHLRKQKRDLLAALLAIGLDPERCVLFYQSTVPAHSELQWILSCSASMGYLSRMTQWKSKMNLPSDATPTDEAAKASLKHGLFSYPILQAADILVHRATHVPVGEDQKQHLEFARECVTNFNNAYGKVFVPPRTILSPARRVMSLQKPTQKMSKSDPDRTSRILLTDEKQEMRKKIMSALTDSENRVTDRYDPVARPGVANLLDIWSHLDPEGRDPADLAQLAAEWDLFALKLHVSSLVVKELGSVRARFFEVRDREEYLDEVLEEGTRKARESAEETMRLVRDVVGLGM